MDARVMLGGTGTKEISGIIGMASKGRFRVWKY